MRVLCFSYIVIHYNLLQSPYSPGGGIDDFVWMECAPSIEPAEYADGCEIQFIALRITTTIVAHRLGGDIVIIGSCRLRLL